MKTKVIFVLVMFSMISSDCIAQGLENKFGLGITGHTSFANRIQSDLNRNSENESHHFFNSVYIPSAGTGNYTMPSRFVINEMTHTDEITEEQVGLVFNKIKEFPQNTQISIAFIENGRVLFYGLKRQNNTIINIDNQSSVFEIGSITKLFTATLLANYINDGTIDPEDHINNYLPFKLNDSIQISFKELANHTSGLPRIPSNLLMPALFNTGNPYSNYSEDKLEKYLTGKAIVTDVSVKSFKYSNLGFGLLGYTLCKIENKSYNDLLNEKIFSKYEMLNSSTIRTELESRLVCGLNKKGNKTQNWDFASLESAGAILSTTEDLSRFAIAQFDELNRELAMTREKTYTIDEKGGIGLGWFISKLESGDILYQHIGVTGGYSSAISINANNKTGIIILSNVSGFSKKMGNIESLCFDLLTTITKEK